MNTADDCRREKPSALRVGLFGNELTISHEAGLNVIIEKRVQQETNRTLLLANHNLHSLALCRSNRAMQRYFDKAEYIWLDGMPVVWMLRLLGHRIDRSWRTTFLDWDHSLLTMADKQRWRIFLLGTTDENNLAALAKLQARYPDVVFAGHHGYILNSEGCTENHNILNKINDFRPDILLVGMGMPLQELWISESHQKLNAKVIMPLGGYFDYIAGAAYTPPRWTGKLGLEWLARLLASPRRLAYRYLAEPWPVILQFSRDLLVIKFFKSNS